jgi:hypothetical protein
MNIEVRGLDEAGMISCIINGVEKLVPADAATNMDRVAIARWEAEGNVIPVYVESITPTEADYEAAIQTLVDATATERKFRDGVTMASYVNSTNTQWAAEAIAFVAWRDGVWAYAYSELDKVVTGQRPQPTVDEFLAEIDPINWPSA